MFMIGCINPIIAETVPETVIVTETVIEYVEVENTDRIEELELQVKQYNSLINNLYILLGNVYYVYGELGNGSWTEATGFSLTHNDKFYLITVGHAIENEYGIFKNLGFKVNGDWIYPKLLDYENKYNDGKDYAIFYSDKINKGFKPDLNNDEPKFKINYSGKIEGCSKNRIIGESGSPVIDLQGEVTGIVTTNMMSRCDTDINTVIEAIDNLK